MKIYILLAMALALAEANPQPVRPSAGRGEVRADGYIFRPDGRRIGSRISGISNKGQDMAYGVEEDNGEGGNVAQQYADQLRTEGAAAAAEANLAAQLGQKGVYSAPQPQPLQVPQQAQTLTYGAGNVIAAGGYGPIRGALGHDCPDGQLAYALGGGNAQVSNALSYAQGLEAAGYQGGFASGYGIDEQTYQLNGLGYASAAAGNRNVGSKVGALFSNSGTGKVAASAGLRGQAVNKNLRSQGNVAGQAVLGSGKLSAQQRGQLGLQQIASSAAAYRGSQNADGYSRYATISDYSGMGKFIGQGVEERYRANFDKNQGSRGGSAVAYVNYDEGAQINSFSAGLGQEGSKGAAVNAGTGGNGYSVNGQSLGVGSYSAGVGYLNIGASTGAGIGYGQGQNSGSYLEQGAASQSDLGAGASARRVEYGGIQEVAVTKGSGAQSSQNFNSGYDEVRGAYGASGQGSDVQSGYSGAGSTGVLLRGGEQAEYGASIATGAGAEGGYYAQNFGSFNGGENLGVSAGYEGQAVHAFNGAASSLSAQAGGESKQFVGIGGASGNGGFEGFSSGQGRQENYAGLGASAGKGGVIYSESFDSRAQDKGAETLGVGSYYSGNVNQGQGVAAVGQGHFYGFGAQEGQGIASGGSSYSAAAGGNQEGHSGALGASSSSQSISSGALDGHAGSAGAIGIAYVGQFAGGNEHSGSSASSYSFGGANYGNRNIQEGGRASLDFSGIRYASGSGHAASFAAQGAAHIRGGGSAVKHLVVAEGHEDHYYGHPKYHFEYAVNDPHTGDIKNQWESRDGDVVKGAYSLHEPDGTIRTVEYHSDKASGFQAVVKKSGKSVHPAGH